MAHRKKKTVPLRFWRQTCKALWRMKSAPTNQNVRGAKDCQVVTILEKILQRGVLFPFSTAMSLILRQLLWILWTLEKRFLAGLFSTRNSSVWRWKRQSWCQLALDVDSARENIAWCYVVGFHATPIVIARCCKHMTWWRSCIKLIWVNYHRRKFRSLTSDNMDSWKSSAARKKINRCGKKEDPQARNVREVAKCCVFQCFVCRRGRKVTSLKRRVRR